MQKVLISLNEGLLDRVDKAAAKRGLSRSTFIAQLAEREIDKARGPGQDRLARQAMKQIDDLFRQQRVSSDATAAVREARDSR